MCLTASKPPFVLLVVICHSLATWEDPDADTTPEAEYFNTEAKYFLNIGLVVGDAVEGHNLRSVQ